MEAGTAMARGGRCRVEKERQGTGTQEASVALYMPVAWHMDI